LAVIEFSSISLHNLCLWMPWPKVGVVGKGFSPQAIGIKMCMRISRLLTEPISPAASSLARSQFRCQPWAWCRSYFLANRRLCMPTISPSSSSVVWNLFPHQPRTWLVLPLNDFSQCFLVVFFTCWFALLVIEMNCFSIYICLSSSLSVR
jgi:hypothetical protein